MQANVIIGMTLGYTDEIEEYIKEDFSESNISHILAVSGMHVGYLVFICRLFLGNTLGKKKTYIFSIIILIYYIFLTGVSPSVVRAAIMAIMVLISKLIYKNSDVWTNISLSLLMLLFYNPFLIQNIGLVLSYIATIGIIIYLKNFKKTKKSKFKFKKILEPIKLTFFISIFIGPIIAKYFNRIPLLSLFVSAFIGIFAGPIIILTIIFVLNELVGISKLFINAWIKQILNVFTMILIKLAEFISNVPFSSIRVVTPNMVVICLFYVCVFIVLFLLKYKDEKTVFGRRVNNLIHLFMYKLNQNKNRFISIVLVFILFFSIIKIIPKNLKINFIYVGQGDSCLIVTPRNKKILIDGGGSENYDVGKNILLPYLLGRGIKSLDYVIISHFDTDHVGGLLTVMEELKVKTAIVSKQGEISENYKKFIQIVKQKHIKVIAVGKGDKLKIEKELYFDILWPNDSKLISENILNNNSMVCKLHYKKFTMIFTGDIEQVAEKQILQEYASTLQMLDSVVLKVAHHGSKTSSIQDFVNAVKPQIALVGVGKNNNFGHPNEEVIKRLINCGAQIFRTDESGEISVVVDNKGKIKVKKYLKE